MPLPNRDTSDPALSALAARAGALLLAARWRVALAESCTGGWVAKCLTDVPGSSQWFERGYVTYSNQSKEQALGVAPGVIETFGAVSRPTAEQMAAGALHSSGAQLALAITGVAGPDGGAPAKPVGLVWFALAARSGTASALEQRFDGDREAIRRSAVAIGLELIIAAVQDAAAGSAPLQP
jgi:nicotinamide-nucleotide amidase